MVTERDIRLTELTLRAVDEVIEPGEFAELNELLRSDQGAVEHYVRLLGVLELLPDKSARRAVGSGDLGLSDSFFDNFLRHALQRMERQAETIELPPLRPEPRRDHTHKLVLPRWGQRVRFWVGTVSAAALVALLVAGFVQGWLAPRPVATLGETVGAVWVTEGAGPAAGQRLLGGGEVWHLRRGLAEVEFDSGASVILEGPAAFRVVDAEEMELLRGRAVLQAGGRVEEFRVATPGAVVTDLGTEVGMEVLADGTLEAHMLEGLALVESREGVAGGRRLAAGHAVRVSRGSGAMKEIELAVEHFARHIDGASGMVWRGESVQLTDFVGRGNGLGTGLVGSAIDAETGEWLRETPIRISDELGESARTQHQYRPVEWCSYVDGVFIPEGSEGPVVVSTLGHEFRDCPATGGTNWGGVINVDKILNRAIELGGVRYGPGGAAALFMHANAGITFDLVRIGSMLPGQGLREFRAVCGVSETYPMGGRKPYADFWVLVDGEVRYSRQGMQAGEMEEMRIELGAGDRFLTLVTTDGGAGPDTTSPQRHSFNDWCVFGSPRLEFGNE